MALGSVNWASILGAAAVAFFVGFLWFGPIFGKAWAKEMGYSKAKMKKLQKDTNMVQMMGISFITSVVTAVVLSFALGAFGAKSLESAIQVTFVLWLGFNAMILMAGVLWEGKSIKLYGIVASGSLAELITISLVLTWWPW